ncbi:MAG: ABC transporter permease [Candidatus Dormibacteraceae bacterium]
MWNYVARRLAISVPILIFITMVLFGLLQVTPGGPLDAMAPPSAPLSPEARAAMAKALGLDQPLPVRYVEWLWQVLHGNLGFRSDNGQAVSQAILGHIGPTLELMGTGILIGIVVGIVLGIFSAVYQYSFFDVLLTILAFLGIAMPAFLAGLLGLYVFSLKLDWFPSGGIQTPGVPGSLGQNLLHLVLPAVMLSINQVAQVMRYTRSSLLEAMSQDYVRTARAKGAGRTRVIVRHAFRNALLPVITIIGANVPNLIGGAVFLETIFTWPGMGQLFLTAVQGRDYSLIMGMTLIVAIVVLLANLLTDLTYAAADPRIRFCT